MTNPASVEPFPIHLIKDMCNGRSDEYFVKLKFCIYPTSTTLDLYEFKMSFFAMASQKSFCYLYTTST